MWLLLIISSTELRLVDCRVFGCTIMETLEVPFKITSCCTPLAWTPQKFTCMAVMSESFLIWDLRFSWLWRF